MSINEERLRELQREWEAGSLSADAYYPERNRLQEAIEAEKAKEEAQAKNDAMMKKGCFGCLGIIGALVLLTLLLSMCGGGSNGGPGGGAGGRLRESEAEIACEREVADQLGGGSFDQGANWEISGGWQVNGMVTHDGQRTGYSCEVTGPSGSHRVTNVQIG